ncbi:hypothetical protein ABPG72_012711 [Tetrahymena utriculariae]
MLKIEEEQQNKDNCFSYEICTNWDIKWQFDLRKIHKQTPKKESFHVMCNSDDTVQNKIEQAINKLEYCYYEKKYDNNSTSTTPIVPKSEQKRVKLIRKMAEKTFKAFKMKLSDISKELQEDKNNMKLWFRKKLESQDDNNRILEKCRKWIHDKLNDIEYEDFLKVVYKYTKSCQKEEAKRYKIPDPSMILKKSFVLHPNPPGEQQSKNAHLLLYQTCSAENSSSLIHVDIQLEVTDLINKGSEIDSRNNVIEQINNQSDFFNDYPNINNSAMGEYNGDEFNKNSKQNIQIINHLKYKNTCFIYKINGNYYIREKVLWDPNFCEQNQIFQNSYQLIRDIIFEYELVNITKDRIQDLWSQACKQIYSQIQQKRFFYENQKTICQFNSQEAINSQKEHLIQISIILKNKNQQVIHKEQIEWDIMSDINNAEQFAEILTQDLGLEKNYVAEISKQIRDQISSYMIKKVVKIGKFYPEFNKQNVSETWNRVKEKEFMKKRLVHTMSEDIPLIPDEYLSDDFPQFKNLEMFNLLKSNLDVMPPKFQEKLIAIEKIEVAQKKKNENESPFLNIDKAMRCLDPSLILHDNPYVPQILRENRHVNDLELELEKKRAVFNNPLLAAQMS